MDQTVSARRSLVQQVQGGRRRRVEVKGVSLGVTGQCLVLGSGGGRQAHFTEPGSVKGSARFRKRQEVIKTSQAQG